MNEQTKMNERTKRALLLGAFSDVVGILIEKGECLKEKGAPGRAGFPNHTAVFNLPGVATVGARQEAIEVAPATRHTVESDGFEKTESGGPAEKDLVTHWDIAAGDSLDPAQIIATKERLAFHLANTHSERELIAVLRSVADRTGITESIQTPELDANGKTWPTSETFTLDDLEF